MQKVSDVYGGHLWIVDTLINVLRTYIEAKHVGDAGFDCSYCGKHCPSKNALTSHVSRQHRSANY